MTRGRASGGTVGPVAGGRRSWWTTTVPVAAFVVLVAVWGREDLSTGVVALIGVSLAAAVLVAVHHAEVVAHRVGEPFGSLILAVAVTVIEVGLIVSIMATGGPGTEALARDTVFAAFMITCNGLLGLCLLVGGLRHRVVNFSAEGSCTALATVAALATLCLVLPTFTTSTPGPTFTGGQLAFAAIASVTVYGSYVLVQTVRHRDYFRTATDDPEDHAPPPSTRIALQSLGLLAVALVAVVGLAKTASPALEAGVAALAAPPSAVGVAIALLVLLPETVAGVRAAAGDRLQSSINLAFGSALASIGLTIPAIAVASLWLDGPLLLGLGGTEIVLLVLTVGVATLTVAPGRATVQEGVVHLLVFTAFLVTAVIP